MYQLSRRAVLRLLGVSGIGMSAGCASVPFFGDNSEHDPGALVVNNRHSLAHVVGVSVSVTAPESVETEKLGREAILVLENGLEGQIPVDTGETKVYPDFLSGSVMYTVKVWLGSTGAGTTEDADDEIQTAEFSPAATETPDARGSFLTVRIEQDGALSWHVTYVY